MLKKLRKAIRFITIQNAKTKKINKNFSAFDLIPAHKELESRSDAFETVSD